MRLTLLNFIFLTVLTTSYAQYSPMLEEGSEWYYYFWFEASCNETLRIEGDTLINGLTYKQMRLEEPCNHDYVTFLREDTTSRQVFLKNFDDTEFMIYDYSMEVGDTFFITPDSYDHFLVLDSITNNLPVNSNCDPSIYPMTTLEMPKVFYLRPNTGFLDIVIWIEGIGNITDPIYSGYTWTQGALGAQVLCHLNEEGVRDYHDLSFSCEEPVLCQGPILNTRNLATLSEQIKVYPNPAANEIRIEAVEDGVGELVQIFFYDTRGQLLKKQALSNGETIGIANLKPGLVIGIVEMKNGDRYSFKFVKT